MSGGFSDEFVPVRELHREILFERARASDRFRKNPDPKSIEPYPMHYFVFDLARFIREGNSIGTGAPDRHRPLRCAKARKPSTSRTWNIRPGMRQPQPGSPSSLRDPHTSMPSPSDSQRFRDILHRLAQYGTLDDPEVAAHLSTGLTAFLARWKEEVLPFLAAGGAELRFIEGPNGRGKTHFLQTLEICAQREGFVTSRVECGMQHKPFASLQDTYRAVVSCISAPASANNGASSGTGLAWLLGQLSAEQLEGFQHASRGNPGFRNLVIAYAKRAQAGQLRDPVSADLRALIERDPNRHVTFSGLFENARQMGVSLHRPLGRIGKRNASVWLRSLLALPRQLGFKGLVVLFDETGADLSIRSNSGSRREHQQHLANLRNLVDHLATGGTPACSIVYATTRDLVEIAKRDYPALSQRVERSEDGNFAESVPP